MTFAILLANFIKVLHLLFIIFILTGWTQNDVMTMILYVTTVFTLQVHWLGNDDTCALTLMEQKLRGKEYKEETFFGQLVKPVYKMDNEFNNQLGYLVTTILFAVVVYKLYYNKKIPTIIKAFKKGFVNGLDKLRDS